VDGKGHVATSSSQADRARSIAARVVWGIFLVFGLVLAAGALLIALEANHENSLVDFVLDFADGIDLGVFDLRTPIREFSGDNSKTKEALLSYGLGAVTYLIVGRILERLIQPGPTGP
jgi:zinc transporter ZupT